MTSSNRPFKLCIPDFDSIKLYILHELFPFKAEDKRIPFHTKCNENKIYFYPLINAYGVQLMYANRVLCIKNLLVAD